MKLATTRDVFAYWDGLRGRRVAPERGDIAPAAIARALGDVFMLDLEPGFGHPFRLAGTRLCAAFGRELRGSGFFLLWADIAPIRDLMDTLEQEVAGAVGRVTAKNIEGQTLALEMLLLPLGHRGRMPRSSIPTGSAPGRSPHCGLNRCASSGRTSIPSRHPALPPRGRSPLRRLRLRRGRLLSCIRAADKADRKANEVLTLLA
jgi:hypothetical protein